MDSNSIDPKVLNPVREALFGLPDLYDDLFTGDIGGDSPWMAGFVLAKRIRTVLYENGFGWDEFGPADFHGLIEEWLSDQEEDPEGIVINFDRNWNKLRLPESHDPAEFMWRKTMRGRSRMNVDRCFYTTRKQIEDAQTILTFFWHLQEWHKPNGGETYCATRKVAKMMGKGQTYVQELIRRLKDEGRLRVIVAATPNRAARFEVVPTTKRRKNVECESAGSLSRSEDIEDLEDFRRS